MESNFLPRPGTPIKLDECNFLNATNISDTEGEFLSDVLGCNESNVFSTHGRSFSIDSMLFPRWAHVGEPDYRSLVDHTNARHIASTSRKRTFQQISETPDHTNTSEIPSPNLVTPGRPRSAYDMFFKSELERQIAAANESKEARISSTDDLFTAIERRWNELSEDQREIYIKLARDDSLRYHSEIQQYNHEHLQTSLVTRPSKNPPPASSMRTSMISCENRSAGNAKRMVADTHGTNTTSICNHQRLSQLMKQIQPRRTENDDGDYHGIPFPPGMEIELCGPDGCIRRYRVEYKCYLMTMQQAESFIKNLRDANYPQNHYM